MKRILFLIIVLFTGFAFNAQAQKYFTKNGTINFSCKGPTETMEAVNKTTSAVIDSKTGAIAFSVLIKGFVFEKKLMQDHFNDKYLESDKYPKGEFKGTITDNSTVKYTVDGTYNVTTTGKLTIHGVTKDVTATGKITVGAGKIAATSEFTITLADYNISADSKIGKTVKITVKTGAMDKLK